MWGPREVLNELRWRLDDLEGALVRYVHRGAPGDARAVAGSDVLRMEHSFLVLRDARRGETRIPYHRVFRVEHRGDVVWERRGWETPRAPAGEDGEGAPLPEAATPEGALPEGAAGSLTRSS